MTTQEYDVLSEVELEDPDVAFLSGTDDLEFRSPDSQRKRSYAGRDRRTRPLKSSKLCAPTTWIVMLCLLFGGLIIALTVVLYHRSIEDSTKIKIQAKSLPPAINEHFSAGMFDDGAASPRPSDIETVSSLSECTFKDFRLPDHLRPNTYNLDLHPSLVTDEFNGTVLIVLNVWKTTNLVVLHTRNLTLSSLDLRETDKQKNLIHRVQICTPVEQLQISTKTALTPGTAYHLRVQFRGVLGDTMHGFYLSRYKDEQGIERKLATTQFEDTHARSAFPCFDEPAFKAKFRVKIKHDNSLRALFNTPLQFQTQLEGDLVADDFEDTPKMSAYLVAFILCDFGNKTAIGSNGLQVNIFAVHHKLNQTDYALATAVKVVTFFETFFGINYPLRKLDLIAIPDFSAGAMENWGLITFRESALLYDSQESGLAQMQRTSVVVAHELAHQWFGNLVTMAWWDQLWLNEGFAAFMEFLGSNASDPNLGAWDQITTQTVQLALFQDTLVNTHAIVQDVKDTADITSRFDDISYLKGASVLHMLYDALGADVFRDGVKDYLYAHEYSNATTADLWTNLDAAWQKTDTGRNSGLSVPVVADTWTNQPGFPVLKARWKTDTVLEISQEKMVPMQDVSSDAKWIVPITVVTNVDRRAQRFWLKKPSGEFEIAKQPIHSSKPWYKLNAGQVGFYRINYEETNWRAMISDLALNDPDVVMDAVDRSHLVDDAFSLARFGKLNITIPLDLVLYLNKEKHFLVWMTARPYFMMLQTLLFTQTESNSFEKFQGFRRSLISKLFDAVTGTNCSDAAISQRRLCILIFSEACDVNLPQCIEKAKNVFSELRDFNIKIPVDIRKTVYETVVKVGGAAEWEFLWQRYLATNIASEKTIILSALAATKDALIIQRYLQYAFDSKLVRPGDTVLVLEYLSANYAAREAVWKTIRHKWDLIIKRYGEDTSIASVILCVGWMSSLDDLHEVKSFFEQAGRKLGAGIQAYNQTIETIKLRGKFLDLFGADMSSWVHRLRGVQKIEAVPM